MENNFKKNDIFIFLGSYVEDQLFKELKYSMYKGNIAVSNSEYERVVFNEFINTNLEAYFISAPIVGKWPFNCKKLIFKKKKSTLRNVIYCTFSTFFILINLSKRHAFKKEIKKLCRINKNNNIYVICCEMHRPYLEGAKLAYKKYNAKTLCIVPDLPKHMLWSKNKIYKYLKNKDIYKCHNLTNKYINSYIFFTDQMKKSFILSEKKYLVREGVIESVNPFHKAIIDQKQITCAFVGKIDRRNGIDAIIYCANSYPNILFKVYGSGEMETYLNHLNMKNLKYFGFINPNEVNNALENADILLSPRYPIGEYVSYSFPSKILKYISLNKPIVTFKLPCFTEKFSNILIYPESNTKESFARTIDVALSYVKTDFSPIIKKNLDYLMVDNLVKDIVKLLKSKT